MNETDKTLTLPDEVLMNQIYLIRDQKVMLDMDLARLYGVETKQLKRQVRRNIERFPTDFMFELSKEELELLRCQFGTSKQGGLRYLPMAFTEQGVAMLSSVLNSQTAIRVNIRIIRVFLRMREMLMTNKELLMKVEKLEKEVIQQGNSIAQVFDYLKNLMRVGEVPRNTIGFRRGKEK